jgi:hypothetical protein
MDDCLRYALVSGKKALEAAGLKQGSDAFNALNKQRCARPRATPRHGGARAQDCRCAARRCRSGPPCAHGARGSLARVAPPQTLALMGRVAKKECVR